MKEKMENILSHYLGKFEIEENEGGIIVVVPRRELLLLDRRGRKRLENIVDKYHLMVRGV